MILWSNILIPVASMMITVFATLYTVNQRVKNENKEKHKPYLTLDTVEPLSKIDEYKFYLTIIGKNKQNETDLENLKKKEYLPVTLKICNIGYGVASNIKFYDLLTGQLIHGSQKTTNNQNQKLFTTFDIATTQEKQVQAKIISKIKMDEEIETIDHCRILCAYQDLNGNKYDFIISINVKTNKSYDFFAYQRTSNSYKRWIKQNNQQYQTIKKQYNK